MLTTIKAKLIAIIIITIILMAFSPTPGEITGIGIAGHSLTIADGSEITNIPGMVTRVCAQATGFAAHSHLAGAEFYALGVGDHVVVYHETGKVRYKVVDVVRFTALEPLNPYGDLVDAYGYRYTSHQVYMMMYGVPGRLVLQTCADGARDRMFWIGEP